MENIRDDRLRRLYQFANNNLVVVPHVHTLELELDYLEQ